MADGPWTKFQPKPWEKQALPPTYGDAKQAEDARKVLEDQAKTRELSPLEAKTLQELQAASPENAQEYGAGNAQYRGFAGGATLNARDNIVDFFGGDGQTIRDKDAASRAAYPSEFGIGSLAGGGASMAIPGFTVGKLAMKLPALAKIIAYGTAGALNGGTSGFMDETGGGAGFAGPDLVNRLNNAKEPAAWGAAIGMAAPMLASGGGALARLLANRSSEASGIGSRAVSRLKPAIADTAVGDIQQYLKSLGPEGMIADIPGPLQNQAMGLASMQGRGGAELSRAVNARAIGAGPRIQQTMDTGITGPNAAFDLRRANAAERTNVLGPEYDAALNHPDQLSVDSVLNAMDPNAIGAPAAAMRDVRTNLGIDISGTPLNTYANAPKVHNVRSELSDAIAEATRQGKGGFVAKTKPVLNALDATLDNVPGYKDARTGYANNKAMDRAIDDGQEALRGGRATAASPAEFKVQFDKLSPAQKDAFRTGMRRDIAGLMGTAKNEAASAWQEFAKTWNEEKLRIALGADADPIINRLKAEKVFSETRGRIDAGSMTAKRTEATKGLVDANPEFTGNRAGIVPGLMNTVNKNVVDPLTFGPRRSWLNADMGAALSKSGTDAEAMVQEIMRQITTSQGKKYPAITEMLLRRALLGAAGGQAAIANQ